MSSTARFAAGWRGICLVAITYVYFLISAQFAFLKRLAELGITNSHLKIVLAAMATGGIVFSLLSGASIFGGPPRLRLQGALCICAATAALTLLPLDLPGAMVLSFLIGAGLGVLTVTLVSNLDLWLGSGDGLLKVGLGTGLGYLICNLPPLFTARISVQAVTAALLCMVGVFAATKTAASLPEPLGWQVETISFRRVLIALTALVWLDSAAFFIIQNTASLKADTWEGSLHLWVNGLLHLVAAVASVLLLRRRGLSVVLGSALLALACACLLLLDPGHAVIASVFYPVGVSLYSVALVAYPSLLSGAASPEDRARTAGVIYAIAGWFGSAMGIGMGEHLGHVPVLFVLLATVLVLGPHIPTFIRAHRRVVATIVTISTIAFCIYLGSRRLGGVALSPSSVERGKQVYISEGCINCHSQYVRPHTSDVLIWGPTKTTEELHAQRPPLIGNRRQGPDLSQVGGRRSALWMRAHFYDPRQVSHASFMPAYTYLFHNSNRGNDLIAYLGSLKSPTYASHVQLEQAWQPAVESFTTASPDEGAHLFQSYCATCHEPDGATRLKWLNDFRRVPPNLQTGPWLRLSLSDDRQGRDVRLARIIKFGITGTDMPGHEYLSDQDVSSIAGWVDRSMVQHAQLARTHISSGETQ